MNQLKVFTVKEANEVLPRLTPLLETLRAKRDRILSLEVEIDALELISDKKKKGVSPIVHQQVELYTQTVNEFYAVIDSIHETGCVIKDVDIGLVDFYALYKGKIVYLCWKLGESEVAHWHDIGSGFSNRQPIGLHTEH